MQTLIINGSPKGDKSITLQTMRYLELRHPEESFKYYNAAARIRAIEKDPTEIIQLIQQADLVVFCYPVYTFMAPAQLHQLISILKAEKCDFSGIYMTQFSTSKHFYDVTAHRYLEDNCHDLGFTVLPGLSADMEDLPKVEGQKQAMDFWTHTRWLMNGKPGTAVDADAYTVTLLTDADASDTSLLNMIEQFQQEFPCQTRILNLQDFPFQGGCLGCLKCAATGTCIYTDGFDSYLRNQVQATDALIFAFRIKDHSMGTLFKLYDDRQFCNGHRTVMMGHPVGYLISGSYSKEANLQMIVQARAQVGGNYLAGVATDAGDMTAAIRDLTEELIFALEHQYLPPKNFYGVGGLRIFRDLIYQMQGLMKLDHKFFKSHGQYDFPKKGMICASYLIGAMFSNPKLMKKMGSKIDEGMMMPYKKVLDQYTKEK